MTNEKGNGGGGNIGITEDALAAAFAKGMSAALAQAQGPKPESPEAYLARKRALDPANQLTRPVFQNGQPIQIKGCSQDTVKHLNALQPGRYLGGAITVTVKGDPPNEQVHITYPSATNDDRLKIYSLVSSFSDMVQKIAIEQREQGETVAAR